MISAREMGFKADRAMRVLGTDVYFVKVPNTVYMSSGYTVRVRE